MKKKLIRRAKNGVTLKKEDPLRQTYNSLIALFKHLIPGFTEAAKGKKYEPLQQKKPPVVAASNPLQFHALQANNLTGQQVGLGGMQVVNGNFQPVQVPKKLPGGKVLPTTNRPKQNLNPPSEGILGTIKRNLQLGHSIASKMSKSVPLNILGAGIGAGLASANLLGKGKLFADWLVKDPNPGLDLLLALGWIGAGPAIGIAMFDPFRWSKSAKKEDAIKKYGYDAETYHEERQNNYDRSVRGYQEGNKIQADNTRVLKPIPGIIDPSSRIGRYDGFPFRVSKNYPYNDHWELEVPSRKYNSPFEGKMNVKYPYIYGVEVTSLGPEYIQKISGKDTTYFTRGDDNKFYEIVGLEVRPRFREAFKNPKEAVTPPNYFNTPEKIERIKKVISNWNK